MFNIVIRTIISFLLMLIVTNGHTQSSSTKFLRKLAVQDLEHLRESLKNIHPLPFAYTSETEFNHLVDLEIEALKDTVDYYVLRNAARRIVYYMHCAHSNVLSRKITKKEALSLSDKYLPLEVRWVDQNFYVYKNYSKDSIIPAGAMLRSINGVSIEDIRDSLKTYRSGDGPEDDFIRGIINLPFQFNLLYDLHFPEDSIYQIEWLDTTNVLHLDTVLAIYEHQEPKSMVDTFHYNYISKHKNLKFCFMDSSIAYLKITDFNGVQSKYYHYIFKLLAERKSTDLILDLRFNYGGGMDNANDLMSYIIDSLSSFSLETPVQTREFDYYDGSGFFQRIAGIFYFSLIDNGTYEIKNGKWCWKSFIEPRVQYNYNNSLYILINEHTLSAASYLASQLKHRADAILIGAPSGGGEFGNAGYTYTTFTLPNSNSKIKVPHNWINYDIDFTNNHELYPNYIVKPMISDLIKKNDVVMKKTLEIINTRRRH